MGFGLWALFTVRNAHAAALAVPALNYLPLLIAVIPLTMALAVKRESRLPDSSPMEWGDGPAPEGLGRK